MSATIGDTIRTLSDSGRHRDIPLVWHAYEFADRAHRRQKRVSGDRYITHPVQVAGIVAEQGGTTDAVCAALLHDVIEDAPVPASAVHAEFGPRIGALVEQLTDRSVRGAGPVEADLALVTVADRLHNLRTLAPLPAASRRRASLDSLTFHVPLARDLGKPELGAELTGLACAALDSLDRPGLRERRRALARTIRGTDPRRLAEALAASGGGAALISSGAVPEWALASGGAGAFAVLIAVLFRRDPGAAQRLAELLRARRQD
ncbi:hypothetical protein GCM10010168_25070 [Actinoplanes ianthinogenes]|uniref:HD/PDEase domain-containing protein n=1 Tax=Actinoplanes ianthinogenes TaxID=122358 RepID=A0ABM7M950_9ACTN|nr:HD domain-containing protein [Actinoplanes ianthinogenes]BCJ48147.1 hypothetical protein Aiant_88040 [Actinoplanes ianthinogenes]GGR06763.1 hypothetical protein GCM10010168_25070 [Actinoplanes ianthinogenes]